MPYIKPEARKLVDPAVDSLVDVLRLGDVGWVNYAITRILVYSWKDRAKYEQLNAIIGVLECVKLEFYRIFAQPYEDTKREQNGPVKVRDDFPGHLPRR